MTFWQLLTDKYEILSLKTLAMDTLSSLAITKENVISAATVTFNYKLLFEDVSQKLLMSCLKFLLKALTQQLEALPLSTPRQRGSFPTPAQTSWKG